MISKQQIQKKPILLIKPRLFFPSILYELIIQDGFFFFCRLNYKFYATKNEEKYYRVGMQENELLKRKNSFKLSMNSIFEIHMETKRDPWTASWDNYGIVQFKARNQTHHFILCSQTQPSLLTEELQKSGFNRFTFLNNTEPRDFIAPIDKRMDRKNTKKVNQLGYVFNILTAIAAIWVFFLPYSLTGGAIMNILLPIAALFAQWKYRGFFRSKTRSSFKSNSSFFIAILLPPLVLSLKVIIAVHIVHIWTVCLVLLFLTVVCVAFCLIRFRRLRSKTVAFVLMLFIFAFLYSSVLTTNSMVITRPVAQYQAIVENRYTSHTYRSTIHYLTLSPWGDYPDNNNVSVDIQTYYQASIGDTIHILQERGLWGIEWNDMRIAIRR
jgi:hypothetical protein